MFYFLACNSVGIKHGSYKGLVKTYKNEYGDIFDCIDIYHQPSLGHRFLANHTIQLKPTKYPKNIKCYQHSKIQKGWNITNHCPKGSIPIIRSHKHDARNHNTHREIEIAQVGTTGYHRYYGAGAILEVWKPTLADPSQNSLAQVKLSKYHGTRGENSISAGWRVHDYPNQGNSPATRFFIRWTADGHRDTGCYNLECAGFIQTNHEVEINGALPIHSLMAILIENDVNTKNWWLYKDCVQVGYWPQNIFTSLGEYAPKAFFGGEVTNMNIGAPPTTTEMGSGKLPNERRGRAASINSIKVKEHSDDQLFVDLDNPTLYVTRPSRYDVLLTLPPEATYGVTIHYGGPE
ncbi:hypothetical protein QQ045_020264 [Rhodiola kirilowii]